MHDLKFVGITPSKLRLQIRSFKVQNKGRMVTELLKENNYFWFHFFFFFFWGFFNILVVDISASYPKQLGQLYEIIFIWIFYVVIIWASQFLGPLLWPCICSHRNSKLNLLVLLMLLKLVLNIIIKLLTSKYNIIVLCEDFRLYYLPCAHSIIFTSIFRIQNMKVFFFFSSSLTSFVKVDWPWTLLERFRDFDTNKNNRTSIIFLIRWKRGLTENERSSKWETCNWFIVPNN